MRRAMVVTLVLILLAGALSAPASAGKKKKAQKKPKPTERVVRITYAGGSLGASTPAGAGGTCLINAQGVFECLETPTEAKRDIYVQVEVADNAGQTVAGFISQNDNDGDGSRDGYGEFCGAQTQPVALETPGAPLRVSIYAGTCADGSSPSVVTMGTITLTFSNLP